MIVTGARQTGKSTLVRRFPGGSRRTYRTLDDLAELEIAETAPEAFVGDAKAVTIDEVQRAPDLLIAIKREVDRRRRPARFLLTGSANLLLLQRVSETLAGRAAYLTLWPLTAAEAAGRAPRDLWRRFFRARSLSEALRVEPDLAPDEPSLEDLIRRGGYPVVLGLRSASDRDAWFDGYVRTYLERDLQQIAQIDALVDFRRLMRAAALRIGQMANQAELARDVGLSPATAHRYLNLLEVSYQLVRLPPFAVNRTKRLIKAPKIYWSDTGLGCFLAGASAETFERQRGALLENFVLAQGLAWRDTETPRPEILWWRTASGTEVDFVIEWKGKALPVEVKSTARLRAADARGTDAFVAEYPDLAPFGIVLHTGTDVRPLSRTTLAFPVRGLI